MLIFLCRHNPTAIEITSERRSPVLMLIACKLLVNFILNIDDSILYFSFDLFFFVNIHFYNLINSIDLLKNLKKVYSTVLLDIYL